METELTQAANRFFYTTSVRALSRMSSYGIINGISNALNRRLSAYEQELVCQLAQQYMQAERDLAQWLDAWDRGEV